MVIFLGCWAALAVPFAFGYVDLPLLLAAFVIMPALCLGLAATSAHRR